MAHVTTLPNGKVLIDCPECDKTREASSFQGNPDHAAGWYTKCSYCRKKEEVENTVGKPRDAEWDDVAETCGSCAGSGRYYAYSSVTNGVSDLGPCFRCKGKGKQTWRDKKRNLSYDTWRAGMDMHHDMRSPDREYAEKVVEGLKNVGPSREEVEVKKPLPKPKAKPCNDEGDEFILRSLFDTAEEYDNWMDGSA